MIGPPLAFMLALNYGFTTMFSIAAGIFVISLALIAIKLPSVPRVEQPSEEAAALRRPAAGRTRTCVCCLSPPP